VNDLLFEALQAMVAARGFSPHYSSIAVEAVVNGAIGITAFLVVERGPEAMQRRRLQRGRRRF
jgi:hypothetical protein